MASFLMEGNVTLLLAILCIVCCTGIEGKGTLQGDHIVFSPLRKGSNYTLGRTKSDWFLSSYDSVAEAVVLSLNSSPPYDAIKDGLRTLQGINKFTAGDIAKKAITENPPLTLLTSVSLISAFVIPLVGITFGCFRCKGQCGGALIEEDLESNPKKRRQMFTAAISICTAMIMIAAFSISLINDRTENAAPALDSLFMASIVDIAIYKENTLNEVSEVTGENMNFTIGLITQELNYLPVNITAPVIKRADDAAKAVLDNVKELGSKLGDLRDSIKDVADIVQNLRMLGQKLRDGLSEVRKNLTDAKSECNNDEPSKTAGACDKIPTEDPLEADADFNKVPGLTQELSKLEGILARNDFEAQSAQGQIRFMSMTSKVNEKTLAGREEITNFTKELQDFAAKMVNTLGDAGDSLQTEILLPMKTEVHSTFGRGGLFNRYDKYRWITLLSISLAVVFVVLLTFLSLISGALGASPSDTPSTRSNISNCAGNALMCVVGLYFFSSFFLNLILAVTFYIGANATILCKSAADLSLLENTIDDPSTLGYYPISKAVLGNGILDIRLSDILRRCDQKETPWELLKMDSKFKFENMTSYRDKIPPMDEILAGINSSITDLELVSDDTRKAINDTYTSGVQEIEFYKFSMETALPLTKNNLSLTTFANELGTAADGQVNSGIAGKLRSTKDALNNLHDDTVLISQPLVGELAQKTQTLMTKNMKVLNDANQIDLFRERLKTVLESDGLELANEAGKKSLSRTLGWMDEYLKDTIDKLRNDVGDCQPIRNVYDVLVSDACDNAVALVNALWLSLGVITMFSVITIILCVRLAKHLRRAKTGDDDIYSEESTSNYGVPLRLFEKFPKLPKKKFSWKKAKISSPPDSPIPSTSWTNY
ncbi:prominin-2-like isoform X2 [Stylophora pistillata]|uniref:prominin-2-like isoform X2 n=1 Tax=Stylophora pistillata TaxID=50429 RepID=UPI000C04E22A|nr:prominin-2-like isoform X2 [Stylophora pistillata]